MNERAIALYRTTINDGSRSEICCFVHRAQTTIYNAKNYVADPNPRTNSIIRPQAHILCTTYDLGTTSGRLATVLRVELVTLVYVEFVTCTSKILCITAAELGGRTTSTSGAAATAIRFFFFKVRAIAQPARHAAMTTTAVRLV